MHGFFRAPRPESFVPHKAAFRILLMIAIGGFWGMPRPACGEPYGNSGGVRNEGDTGVNILITDLKGDYQWDYLSAGTSLDLPENTSKVGFYDSALSPRPAGGRIQIAVFFPDGSRQKVDKLGEEVVLAERKDKLR